MPRSPIALLHRRYGRHTDALTRREMLKLTAASAGGLLLSNLLGPRIARGASQKRVVVIGAGFAGLTAAYELKSAGYDVSLIEASNRIGGRVMSFNKACAGEFIPGRTIEGGAELIGSNHPHWVAYKEKFGLKFIDVTENEEWDTPIVLGGKKLSSEESGEVWEALDKACNTMNADAEPILEDEPWKSSRAEELDKRSLADWVSKLDASPMCKKAVDAMLAGDNGVACEKASYLGMLTAVKGHGLEKHWTDTEVYRCDGGNQQLAMKLAAEIGERITKSLPVRSIQVKGNGVTVKCADGRTLECDDVVLAVAPSVWSKIDMQPGLPSALSPQLGVNIKYLTHVKKRFWADTKENAFALSDGDVTWTWDATDSQEGDENIGFTAFSGGPAAERMRGRRGEDRKKAYAEELGRIFPAFAENFVAERFMDWPGVEWVKAGYSFPAPGQVTTVGPLMAKAHADRIHLAGEHTCYKFVGYMEGALCSGATVAKRLAKRDGVAK